MYFTKIRLNGLTPVDLHIAGALPSDQYILQEGSGLGPTEVEVSIADTLNAGGVYQGRRPQSREIVLLVGLNPDYNIGQTASELRSELYGMLTPGNVDNIVIDIMNQEQIIASTSGYVKKLEIVPFSKDPKVQMTIACPQQYFQSPADVYLDLNKAYPDIDNIGTAPAGFHMEVIFTAPVSFWTLWDMTDKAMEINYSFLVGDKLIIDTRPGQRGIWVVRTSVTTNIIYTLSTISIWFMLHGGLNRFITSSQGFNWGNVFYRPQYWGI